MSLQYNPQAGTLTPAGPPKPPANAGALRVQFLVLFFVLAVLAIPGIWLILPNFYIQIVGHQTQGKAQVILDCGSDDDDNSDTTQAVIFFHDAQGQLFEIPPDDTCTNFINNGDSLTLWYLPDNPSSTFVLSDIAVFFYVFAGIWLVATLILLFFFVLVTARLIQASAQRGEFGRLGRPALICLVVIALLVGATRLLPVGQATGPTRNYQLGPTVSVDGRWAVTVRGGHPVQVGLDLPPSDGTTCVELDITGRNLTSQEQDFGDSQFTLYTAQEQAIRSTCALSTSDLHNTNVAPGKAITGVLAYEVPLKQSLLYLAFQPDPDNETNTSPFFWKIAVTPNGPNHTVGETVSVDSLWDVMLKSVQINPANIIGLPGPNTTCLALDVTLHNRSGVSLDADSEQFSLYDAQGLVVRYPCILRVPDVPARAAPGSTIETQIGFGIPTGETQFRLAFLPSDCKQACQQAVWDVRVDG